MLLEILLATVNDPSNVVLFLLLLHVVENEYGSWGACDLGYVSGLASLMRHYLGPKTVLFTTDGDGDYFLKCGKIKEAYATVDFGAGEVINGCAHISGENHHFPYA